MSLVIDFSGPAITNPTVSATPNSIPNAASVGTVAGTGNTSIPGATFTLSQQGGLAIQPVGANLEVETSFSVNIMYRRAILIELSASGEITGNPAFDINTITGLSLPTTGGSSTVTITGLGPGVLQCTDMAVLVASTTPVSIPITENGSSSLTIAISGAVTTLTEYNDSLPPDNTSQGNYLGTISASGGTGPYQYSVITDPSSPMEVDAFTGILAMVGFCTTSAVGLGGTAGVNYYTGASQTAVIRAVDSLGNWGTLSVTVNIAACVIETDPELAQVVFVDPANATLSGSSVVSVAAMYGGVPYTVVPPSGSTVTVTPYTGPDGNSRNLFVYPGTSQISLAAGAAYAGSSSALPALFNQTGVANTTGTLMSVVNILTTLTQNRVFSKITDAGGHVVQSYTAGSDLVVEVTNGNGASINFNSINTFPAGWSVLTASSDGNRALGETNGLLHGTQTNPVLPSAGSYTCTAVEMGVVTVGGYGWESGLEVLAPAGLTFHQREKIYAYCARKFGASYTPPIRKTVSQMQPAQRITNFNTAFGTSAYRPLQFFSTFQYSPTTGVCAINAEYAVEVDTSHAGISAVWPEANGYVPASGPQSGALVMPLYAMTPAQAAWLTANPGTSLPHAAAYYSYRGIVNELKYVCEQYLGYFESKVTYPLGDGLTPASWLYNYFGGSADQEIDYGEQYAINSSLSTFTVHYTSGSYATFPVSIDNCSVNPIWFGADWIDNLDGTHTINFYWNRRQIGGVSFPAANMPWPMHQLFSSTTGDGGSPPTSYTPIGNLASAVVIYGFKAWAYPNNDLAQMPQLVTAPSITGTRGNGNTMTMVPGVYNWPAATPTYQWYTFSPQTGFVKLTGQTTLTLTDATAYQSVTLMCQESSQNLRFDHPVLGNAFAEPGTLPSMSLLTGPTSTTGAAQGTVLAWLYNQALGAGVTITSSDVSGNFQMSADGTQVQAGPNWHTNAISVGVTLYVTQTALLSGPTPLAQTFTITPN